MAWERPRPPASLRRVGHGLRQFMRALVSRGIGGPFTTASPESRRQLQCSVRSESISVSSDGVSTNVRSLASLMPRFDAYGAEACR